MFAIITGEMLKLTPNASVVKIPVSAEALLPHFMSNDWLL